MEDPQPDVSALVLPPGIAVRGDETDGLAARAWPEAPHPYRPAFARDIGRILHARAFRRLAGKTQVFTRGGAETGHSRSRLTHTLEVAQIARTLAATMGLNATLAEALALVHDIGHPPFGHTGEQALDEALRSAGQGLAFDHNLHALRIATILEERYPAFPGLNLTLAVREGIVKHSRGYAPETHPELSEYLLDLEPPLEAQLIDLADEIAYLTADIEDGLAAGILSLAEVRGRLPFFNALFTEAERNFPHAPSRLLASEALKRFLDALVTGLMREVAAQVRSLGILTLAELRRAPGRVARLSPAMEAERSRTKTFLFEQLYLSPALEAEHAHAREVVHTLYHAWTEDPELLPASHRARVETQGAPRAVADYIAGMTDGYIEQLWSSRRKTAPGG